MDIPNKITKDMNRLSKSVASRYIKVGKIIGLTKKDLEEASLRGAEKGLVVFKSKKHKNVTYKLSTYLTWWMRRAVHQKIVSRCIKIAKKDQGLAEKTLLDLLE